MCGKLCKNSPEISFLEACFEDETTNKHNDHQTNDTENRILQKIQKTLNNITRKNNLQKLHIHIVAIHLNKKHQRKNKDMCIAPELLI